LNVSLGNYVSLLDILVLQPLKHYCVATPKGPFYSEFGRRLQQARRAAHVTQAELARGIGLSRTSVANIENGRQPVYIHTFVALTKALGASIETLMPTATSLVLDLEDTQDLKRLNPETQNWVRRVLQTRGNEKPNDSTALHTRAQESRGIDQKPGNKKGASTG
jgi:transcriptional regulator with XRE-family HTH domain